MSQIETTSHYELFHALLRRELDPADRERVKSVMDFISTQPDTLNKFLTADEFRLLGLRGGSVCLNRFPWFLGGDSVLVRLPVVMAAC